MSEPNPFDSPQAYAKPPEPKKWWQLTIVEWFVIAGILFVLVGLLMPTATYPRDNSRRTLTANHMKQIGLALHNYHDTYGTLPPAVVTDAAGRPLYSWRVLLLPFLEQQALYEQFDLTQPWDSETNRALAEYVPDALQGPRLAQEYHSGMTPFLAVVDPEGKQTLLLPQEGRSLDEVPGELDSAALVVEQLDHPVIWTKPADISPFELIGTSPIAQNEHAYFPVLMGDGSVQWMPPDDPQQLRECLLCEPTYTAVETANHD